MNSPLEYDPKRRLFCVDLLRGLACLSVLLFHICGDGFTSDVSNNIVFGLLRYPASLGYLGVNLFLILSGFCIHMASLRRESARFDVKGFWLRRLFRLYPPYLVAAVFSIAVGCLGAVSRQGGWHLNWPPHPYLSGTDLGLDLVLHLTMLHLLCPATVYGLFNPPLWSLALEEQLYALYTAARLATPNFSASRVLGTALIVTVIWRAVGVFWGLDEGFPWLLQAPARWFEWCLGALAVESHYNLKSLPKWCYSPWVSLVAFGAAYLINELPIAGLLFAEILYGISFFILLNWLCHLERTERMRKQGIKAWLAFCGIWSYSLYLIHAPVIRFLRALLPKLGVNPTGDFACSFLLLSSLLVGFMFFLVVEKRFLAARR